MAELLSVSPSPSKDQDVFGKELRLSEQERKLLAAAGEIFLSKTVHVVTRKGDGTEPRTLVISSSRCYILQQNPTTKLETSFNFLRIQELQCTDSKLIFLLSGEAKARELKASRRDSVEVISLITAQLKNVFPKTPLDMLLKLTFDPDSLREEVLSLRDELTSMMERIDTSSVQGFLTAYGFLCDFFGVEYSKEVSWFLNNVYLAHGVRELKMSDFDHLPTKDFLPVVSSLRHNSFFEGITAKDEKLGPEVVEELAQVLNSSPSIKTLVLSSCGLRPEATVRLSSSLKNNPRTSLTHLNLSDNPLDDRAVEALGSAIEALPHGLQHLILANCKITVKGATALANSMKQNKYMQFSLVCLDLSGNPLGPDPLGALGFVQDTQTISTLSLAGCSLLLEHVVPLLNRSCTQHLCQLDLSNNTGKGKKVVHPNSVASGLQQFCSSAITIRSFNLSNCKLTTTLAANMLEGLAANPNVTSVQLNLSSNDLGGAGAHQMLSVVGTVNCLDTLDISDCGLENNMQDVVSAVESNKTLCHLKVGRNFSNKNAVKATAVAHLARLLAKEDCQLMSLCVEDSHLKEQTSVLLDAVLEGGSLVTLSLSGNQMGLRGARSLAKALLSNCSLSEVSWDRNETPLRGFQDVAAAMKQNYTLRVMPLPLADVNRLGKAVEEHVQLMQQCLSRNHSDERLKVEIAARHRTRLLTASQQSSAVGRELVQLEDLLQWMQTNFPDHEFIKEGSEVKELANNAIKLTDGLYSPQVESDQFQAITRQVKEVLDQFMEKLFTEHIKAMSERMVAKSMRICQSLLSVEPREKLQDLVLQEKGPEFAQAKKDVLRHALPEIVNHVSDSNVDVAANISELVVEHTLNCLEKINRKMSKLQKETQAKSQQTPDGKVSRNFTFRVQQEENSPTKKKKKRVRRPDPDDDNEDFIDLPSENLETEGPALQHLGKTRPKPARMQRRPPSKKLASSSTSDPPPSNPVRQSEPAHQEPEAKPVSDPSPPQPKVPLKPPTPQMAEKKIKEILEARSRESMLCEEKRSKGSASPEAKKATPEPKEKVAEKTVNDEVEEKVASKAESDIGTEKSASEESGLRKGSESASEEGGLRGSEEGGLRSGSEEVEEHRAVVQLEETTPSGDDKEGSTSPAQSSDKSGSAQAPATAPVGDGKPASPDVKVSPETTNKFVNDRSSIKSRGSKNGSKEDVSGSKSAGEDIINDWEVIEGVQPTDSKMTSPSPDTATKTAASRASPSPETAKKQPPGANPSPETAKKQPPGANPSPETAKKQPPVANFSPEATKKQPPAVREKPRKTAEPAQADGSDKAGVAALANLFQKSSSKVVFEDSKDPPPTSPKPAQTATQESPLPTRSTPSPAPKPRPKPTRKKTENKGSAEAKGEPSQETKDENSHDTLV